MGAEGASRKPGRTQQPAWPTGTQGRPSSHQLESNYKAICLRGGSLKFPGNLCTNNNFGEEEGDCPFSFQGTRTVILQAQTAAFPKQIWSDFSGRIPTADFTATYRIRTPAPGASLAVPSRLTVGVSTGLGQGRMRGQWPLGPGGGSR